MLLILFYTTNNNLGFDYLHDNLAANEEGNFYDHLITLLLTRLMISCWIVHRHLLSLQGPLGFSLIIMVLLIRW